MKELITLEQARQLMLILLIAAPVIGLIAGLIRRRPLPGLVLGLLVGAGNYGLWTMYCAITDRLGLDTVKNLLVNLGLFIVIGVLIGSCAAWYQASHSEKNP